MVKMFLTCEAQPSESATNNNSRNNKPRVQTTQKHCQFVKVWLSKEERCPSFSSNNHLVCYLSLRCI